MKQTFIAIALIVVLTPSMAMANKLFHSVDANMRPGMLVSLTKNPEVVEPATDNNKSSLIGVTGSLPSPNSSGVKQWEVHTEGLAETLVSTIAGNISVGDHISTSSVVGFGAKSDGTSWIVGTAQASLDANTAGAIKTSVSDVYGTKHEVYLAFIPVEVNVVQENASSEAVGEQSSWLPNKVQTFANEVAGKKASQVAVILSFAIFMAGFVIAGIIVNTAVRNGISSTARQPLAKEAIVKRMVQSIIIAMAILVASIISSMIIIRII